MKLLVYKGFDSAFLKNLAVESLSSAPIEERRNVFSYSPSTGRKLLLAFLANVEENGERWITYEEFSYIKDSLLPQAESFSTEVVIIVNNIYPGYYPLELEISDGLREEILRTLESTAEEQSEECRNYLSIYNDLQSFDGVDYANFSNYELESGSKLKVRNLYPQAETGTSSQPAQMHVHISNDIPMYLREFTRIIRNKPETVGFSCIKGRLSDYCLSSLAAYCLKNGISLYEESSALSSISVSEEELIAIARNEIRIPDFKSFRKLRFYKNADLDNETVEISQSRIIGDIIQQAENAYSPDHHYRDIFITAPTGAGKSVMFQIPAVYLAKKYKKLTIIIEPVKALMQDQKKQLNDRGYTRVETFNSDLISQAEKEAVLNRVKNGETDLLYLSPETLLSYSMETLIGDREIGLVIVDEAHIVTTWGVGFRPDYWYLGAYINRLRTQLGYGKKRELMYFPVCAFTATAVNGGEDDSVSETVISLYMENPIKYIGYVKRDDIEFEISVCELKKLPNTEYEDKKALAVANRLRRWAITKRKSVVYFPYASIAGDVKKGIKAFTGKNVPCNYMSVYTGRNLDATSADMAREGKEQAFEDFRTGKTPVMLATKAFGMGIDINDIQNVYHYAVSGNMSDYVQEIGRAARREDLTGHAITDFFANDMRFTENLYGMSRINQYHINHVLSDVYNVYLSKNRSRNFLISPESFTYIFTGKDSEKDPQKQINKLKTSLLMLEKDLYEKYNVKVLISRPRGVFTKAFIVINKDHEYEVLHSKYGQCFRYLEKGRVKERQSNGCDSTDTGDIFEIDLKSIWENHYQNISFPAFKYWYFNNSSTSENKVDIMPEIRSHIGIRQKVTVEAKHDLKLREIREKIFSDFEYVADTLYETFGRKYFTLEELAKCISKTYGKSKARIISHSLFQLADPNGKCIKFRSGEDGSPTSYSISNGTLKELMNRTISQSVFVKNWDYNDSASVSKFMVLDSESKDALALKMLSVFDYVTYEVLGGTEPEIFVRLNDPEKVRRIISGEIKYSNSYVTKARQKHEREVKIMRKFFTSGMNDAQRWDYIEKYFLGNNVLEEPEQITVKETVPMESMINKDFSYAVDPDDDWNDLLCMFDDNIQPLIKEMAAKRIPLPEFYNTVLKNNPLDGTVMISWPKHNVLIFEEEISQTDKEFCDRKGWRAFELMNTDMEELKEALS